MDLPVNPVQLECLQEAIYSEARGEDFAGQVYIGFVIRNRVESDMYPDRYCKVINQPYQFSYVMNGPVYMSEPEARKQAREIAFMVMKTPSILPSNVMYFTTKDIRPSWNWNQIRPYKTHGNHVLYEYIKNH